MPDGPFPRQDTPAPDGGAAASRDPRSVTNGEAAAAAGRLNEALRFINDPLPMWIYDLETLRILDVNDAALALYGYDRHEFVGRHVSDLRGVERAGDDAVHVSSPDAALPVSVTRRHRRKDGSPIDVHILAHPVAFDRRSAVLAVTQDVTDLRHAADAATGAQRHSTATIKAVVTLSTELHTARTVEEAYEVLAGHAIIVACAAHVTLALVTGDGRDLTPVHTVGDPLPWPAPNVPVAGSRLGWVVRTGRPLIGPWFVRPPSSPCGDDAAYQGLGPLVIIPVGSEGRAIGALVVARPAGAGFASFTSAEIRFLEDVGRVAAAAIERIRLMRRLQHAYARTAVALVQAIEMHGGEAGSRAARLTGLAAATAGALGCPLEDVEDVRWGARLYDIGMVAVPDDIAGKPDRLTEQEWAVVRQHPVIADEVLRSVEQLHRAAAIVRHHQERWDGTGYPDRLRGSEIPLGARILAVLEAYAAMSEPRPYRPARSCDEVMAELRRGAGTQFDAAVVEAFCAVLSRPGTAAPDHLTDRPGSPGTRLPGPARDDALLTALRGLPDGARQLVRRLDIEDVELEVEEHLTRVGRWSIRLAEAAAVPLERQRQLVQAAFLHDVGKLSLSRALLRKPGPLSPDERARVAHHVAKGVALLRALEVDDAVVDIVAAHHERWDGGGYPQGLAGEAIPLEARILSIADSFDAMTSERVYHRARTRDEAAAELRREAGRQFDAGLIDSFVSLLEERR